MKLSPLQMYLFPLKCRLPEIECIIRLCRNMTAEMTLQTLLSYLDFFPNKQHLYFEPFTCLLALIWRKQKKTTGKKYQLPLDIPVFTTLKETDIFGRFFFFFYQFYMGANFWDILYSAPWLRGFKQRESASLLLLTREVKHYWQSCLPCNL